jgi:CHASE3 domain sensor protein
MASPEVQREDLSAAVGARRELGSDSEREVVEAFLDRIGTAIDARVDQRLAEQNAMKRRNGEPVAIIIWLVIGAINIVHALRS